jgi:Icc-related predicted phosphoesterase
MRNVYVGDIHGKLKNLCYHIEQYDIRDCNLIQVGDLGLGFNSYHADMSNLKTLNEVFEDRNINFYAIRGNHDDPAFWYHHEINLDRIVLVKDYEVIEIGGDKILFCGGGVSIDRCIRENDGSYFKNEEFVLDRDRIQGILETEDQIDLIVTHNAPMFFYPWGVDSDLVNHYAKLESKLRGTDLKGDLIKERQDMDVFHDLIIEKFDVKAWVYGHFHNSNIKDHTHTRENTNEHTYKQVLLNINEFKQIGFEDGSET